MNDVLKPDVIWIEGRCYRINDHNMDSSTFQEHDLYENDVPFIESDYGEDDEDADCEILQDERGRYHTSFHVSKYYMGYIIGKKGATVARIGNETKTDIRIPRQGENKNIIIYGSSLSSVKVAKRRIDTIVVSSRMKQAYTHFVSLPMNSFDIVKKFEIFKESVLRECSGVDESLFIKPSKLHITIGIMCLMDNEERLLASKLLTEARDKYIMSLLKEHLPFKVRLKGLSYMNDEPKAIHVLYGCVEEDGAPSGLLQRMGDAIHAHFCKAGFMQREFNRDNIKIHVTLLNSRYRAKQKSIDSSNVSQKRETFDGTEILSKFVNYDFGVIELNAIHLSQRGTMSPDGYYQPTCVIPWNK